MNEQRAGEDQGEPKPGEGLGIQFFAAGAALAALLAIVAICAYYALRP